MLTNHPIPEAATYGGALAALTSYVVSLFGVDLPPEVGAALATVYTGLIGFAATLAKSRAPS